MAEHPYRQILKPDISTNLDMAELGLTIFRLDVNFKKALEVSKALLLLSH